MNSGIDIIQTVQYNDAMIVGAVISVDDAFCCLKDHLRESSERMCDLSSRSKEHSEHVLPTQISRILTLSVFHQTIHSFIWHWSIDWWIDCIIIRRSLQRLALFGFIRTKFVAYSLFEHSIIVDSFALYSIPEQSLNRVAKSKSCRLLVIIDSFVLWLWLQFDDGSECICWRRIFIWISSI